VITAATAVACCGCAERLRLMFVKAVEQLRAATEPTMDEAIGIFE
jgi:hypothetical protein